MSAMVLLIGLAVLTLVVLVGLVIVLAGRRGVEVVPVTPPPPKVSGEAMAAGRSGSLPAKSSLLRQVHDSEIEAQIRSGHLIDAIKLYREKTGVGLKEAKDAVEAWRDRMRAS